MKHGLTGYVKYQCRCEICTEAKRVSQKRSLEKAINHFKQNDPVIKTHGTAYSVAAGCRCPLCKLKMSIDSKKHYTSNKAYFKLTGKFRSDKTKHGTYMSYKNYGCRCEACKKFISDKNKENKEKSK